MTNVELIDEGYCSLSKRASLSKWDEMDFTNNFDLGVGDSTLTDATDAAFFCDSGADQVMLNSLDPSLFAGVAEQALLECAAAFESTESAYNTIAGPSVSLGSWKGAPQTTTNTSSAFSLISSSGSLQKINCTSSSSNSVFASPGPVASQNMQPMTHGPAAGNWYDCGPQNASALSSPIAVALPPLQRSSTAPSPLYAQEMVNVQPQYGWIAPASTGIRPLNVNQGQMQVQAGAGPSGLQQIAIAGPSGLQFAQQSTNEEHILRPLVVNSPESNISEPISSPGSTLSGTQQQPLSPTDERRLRNNEASRRSRQNQKTKNEELQIKLYQLELENLSLKKNIDEVTKMVKYMKEKLVEYMQSKS